MNKKTISAALIAVISVLALSHCSSLQERMKKYYPEVSLKDYKIESIDFSQATVVFDFTLKNKAPVEIFFDKIAAELKVEGKSMLKAETVQGIQVLSEASSDFSIRQQFKFADLAIGLADLLKKERVLLRLDGQVVVDGKLFGKINVPFDTEKTLELPKIPQIRVGAFTKKGFDLNILNPKANFELELLVKNPNNLAINVDTIQYAISIENINALSGKSAKQVIAANKETALKIPVSIGGKEILSLINQLKNATSFAYAIHGELVLDILGQKLNFQYKLP